MPTLTINQARRVLGKDAQGVSDAELEEDIEAATFLKDLFFDHLTKTIPNDRTNLVKPST